MAKKEKLIEQYRELEKELEGFNQMLKEYEQLKEAIKENEQWIEKEKQLPVAKERINNAKSRYDELNKFLQIMKNNKKW